MNQRPPARKSLARRKVSDLIADSLREQIVNQSMAVDDRLPPEQQLIDQFSASRGSVREALKSLEVQGLIYNVPGPGGGARVRAVEESQVFDFMRNFFHFKPLSGQQIYAVRKLVEPETAVSTIGHLRPEDFERLQRTIDELEKGDPARDWVRLRNAEIEFHDILAECCPNPLLGMIARFVNTVLHSAARAQSAAADWHKEERAFAAANLRAHRDLLEALRQGNATRVRSLMTEHVHDAELYVVDVDERIDKLARDAEARSKGA